MNKSLTLTLAVCTAIVVGAYHDPVLGVLAGIVNSLIILGIKSLHKTSDSEHFALYNDVADLAAELFA